MDCGWQVMISLYHRKRKNLGTNSELNNLTKMGYINEKIKSWGEISTYTEEKVASLFILRSTARLEYKKRCNTKKNKRWFVLSRRV